MKDDDFVHRIERDFRSAGLSEKQLTMLEYAEKLTRTPSDVTKQDVERLRSNGYSDADILSIAEVTAYYAYVNRIADGLGVEVEPWFVAD